MFCQGLPWFEAIWFSNCKAGLPRGAQWSWKGVVGGDSKHFETLSTQLRQFASKILLLQTLTHRHDTLRFSVTHTFWGNNYLRCPSRLLITPEHFNPTPHSISQLSVHPLLKCKYKMLKANYQTYLILPVCQNVTNKYRKDKVKCWLVPWVLRRKLGSEKETIDAC